MTRTFGPADVQTFQPRPGRIPELDGLRGLAIASVVFSHYVSGLIQANQGSAISYLMAPFHLAWSGVDLFFVLSGFLIGGILLGAKEAKNYFRVFYRRRFFRIVPIYVVALGVGLLLAALAANGHSLLSDTRTGTPPKWTYFLFLQNFWMAASPAPRAVDVTWSLAVEEQFYLTLPLLVWLLSRKNLVRVVLATIVLAPVLRGLLLWIWPGKIWADYVLMPCRADALMLGVLSVILLRDAEWRARLAANRTALRVAMGTLALGLVWFIRLHSANYDPTTQRFGFSLLAFLYASILVYALTNPASMVSRFLRLRSLAWLGGIAYAVYLFHEYFLAVAFALLRKHAPDIAGGADILAMLAALAATLVFCRLSWVYFEKPLIAFGHKVEYE